VGPVRLGDMPPGAYRELTKREVAALPDLDAGAHLLELLPWGGVHTALLRRRYGESVHLHIAELSPHNHAFILERVRQEGLSCDNVHTDSCAGGRLFCADASIDAALLPRMLEHVPEPWRMLDELHRVLKPGGIAVISIRNRLSGEMRRDYSAACKGQVPNTGPYRPLSAGALERELARRFTIVDEFGVTLGEGSERRDARRRFAPIYVVRITRP